MLSFSHFSTLSTQGLTLSESVPVLLAVYEVVTQSHSYRQQSKHIDVSVSILFPITSPTHTICTTMHGCIKGADTPPNLIHSRLGS